MRRSTRGDVTPRGNNLRRRNDLESDDSSNDDIDEQQLLELQQQKEQLDQDLQEVGEKSSAIQKQWLKLKEPETDYGSDDSGDTDLSETEESEDHVPDFDNTDEPEPGGSGTGPVHAGVKKTKPSSLMRMLESARQSPLWPLLENLLQHEFSCATELDVEIMAFYRYKKLRKEFLHFETEQGQLSVRQALLTHATTQTEDDDVTDVGQVKDDKGKASKHSRLKGNDPDPLMGSKRRRI